MVYPVALYIEVAVYNATSGVGVLAANNAVARAWPPNWSPRGRGGEKSQLEEEEEEKAASSPLHSYDEDTAKVWMIRRGGATCTSNNLLERCWLLVYY